MKFMNLYTSAYNRLEKVLFRYEYLRSQYHQPSVLGKILEFLFEVIILVGLGVLVSYFFSGILAIIVALIAALYFWVLD